MALRSFRILLYGTWLAGCQVHAQTVILWNSNPQQTNLTQSGALFDDQFHFELGVFKDGFVPTKANAAKWAAYWVSASSTPYDADVLNRRYDALFTPTDNDPPFASGTLAYVWGLRNDVANSEWILFRATSWKWPNASMTPSPAIEWYAQQATPIMGTIHSSGSPFLMQSETITTWAQWQGVNLAGEVPKGPYDDPDHDGTPNLLEFVFGTPPQSAGAPTPTPVTIVDGHLQITIPRLRSHLATLTVQVSDNLINWVSNGATTEISNTLTEWVVRDQTALGPAHPQRFIRLQAELSTP